VKLATLLIGAALFLGLATANSGGYRYGVSDQAYYAAAVLKARTPALFPRDSSLLAAESSFMSSDKILAALSHATGLDLPWLFFLTQMVTLLALALAGMAFGRALGLSWWSTALFLALLTLRHHIMNTGVNTLEGYMHPRVLAFALGLTAFTGVLRRQPALWLAACVAAALAHPTTGLWFGVATAVAVFVNQPAWRRGLLACGALFALMALWAVTVGPLAGRLVPMDALWIGVLASRDYLFPAAWPFDAWIVNLAYLPVIYLVWRQRVSQGVAKPAEAGLLGGWLALVVVFLVSVPLSAHHIALAVQLQTNRVFWLLDVGATAYLASWLGNGPLGSTPGRRATLVAVVLLLSAVRGGYVLAAAGRQLIAVDLPDTPWTETMRWIADQPTTWNVLADPGHAWKYGSSVRVAAGRDTVLDDSKDPALAMYDRTVAVRVADREHALMNFPDLKTNDLRRLGQAYAADVVVTPRDEVLDLPVLYKNLGFVVYALR
jgi:hypothetical protein